MLKLPGKTIRTRLLISFVLMALLSAVGVTISAVVIGYANGNQQIIDRLESVVARKALEIQVFLDSLDSELVRALNEPYAPERANVVLDLANRHKFYDFYTSALRQRLIRFTAQSDLLESITLLSRDGRPILSTDPVYEVDLCLPPDLFQQGLGAPAVQISYPPASDAAISAPCSLILTGSAPRLITVRPVSGNTDPVAGLIVGTTSIDRLETLLNDRQGIGETGRLYIVTRTGYTAFAQIEREGHAVYDNLDGNPVVGVWREIPELDALVVAEQHLSEGFGAVYANLSINLTLAVIAVLIAIVVAYVITRSITQPLIELLTTVKQISGGDLDRRVPETGSDEVGELAVAFNAMTARLRDLINHLDEQVEARTRALHQVALQLETSAEVSRKLTSILDIDNLLGRVVELIREAFGYYQVLIFLLDAETNRLIIRASTGDMAKRPQTLDILQPGLNAEAARTGRAVLVNDVSTNDQFLADPTLPDTRSELVIPLKVNDKVIGTLDIHSVNQNQFTQEDVRVNQSLGDQIAIAIENAHLYERSRELAIIEERTRLARDLHDSVIQSLYSLSLLAEGWRRRVETD
ncbi:MAG: GAF domain-containing protein, partial [Anaerolinea sp.]|nr:GAF domain-containing protein [Anaerolinea sp.]